MKKKLFFLLLLIVIAVLAGVKSCRSHSLPSRQREELNVADYAKETEFAKEAVALVPHRIREFSRLWQSRGDVYQNALQLLKEHPVQSPQVLSVYRFASNPNVISVVLAGTESESLIVCIWNGGQRLLITDIYREDSEQ